MFRNVSIFSLLILTVLLLAHWLIVRPRCDHTRGTGGQRWYTLLERLVHAGLAVGFVLLACTGMGPVLTRQAMEDEVLQLHMAGAGLFMVCLALGTLLWAADARFVPDDGLWLKAGGGILRPGGRLLCAPPGSRFDAGQKLFFWLETTLGLACLITALLSMFPILSSAAIASCTTLHGYFALALILVVLMHVYAALIVKPEAWKRILMGRSHTCNATAPADNKQTL